MKSKILSLFLFAAIFSVIMVSAADFSITQPELLTKSDLVTTFTITNDHATNDITVNVPQFADIVDGDGHTILLDQDVSGDVTILNGASETITITASLPTNDKLKDLALGTFSQSIDVLDDKGTLDTADDETATVDVEFLSSFCDEGNYIEVVDGDTRELEIVSVKDKSSEDDWEWRPLDEVEIEVKVKFISDDNDDDIDAMIEVGLYDTEEQEFVEVDNEDDLEKDISLDEGDKVTETFTIEIPVEDVEDSSTRYKLYVKVYEEDEEETICRDYEDTDYFQEVEIKKESYDVVLDKVDITTPVPCGQEVEVTATVYNIGTHDEDKVLVNLFNKELGIDYTSNVISLDEGDSKRMTFSFLVPEDAEEKAYTLKAWTSFKYRKSSETYREESEDYDLILKVEGDCTKDDETSAQITAELDSETPEAIAGKQVIINSNIRNTGDVETTYTISVSGNSAWSSLSAIDPQTITVPAGSSKEVSIYLDVDSGVEGDKEFTIKASYGDKTTEQKVALAVTKGVTQDSVVNHLRDNWFIYVIAIVNIILIIAIIAVVKSMVSRGPVR